MFYVIVRSFPFVCETEAAMEASTSTVEAVSEALVLRPSLYALETTARSITTLVNHCLINVVFPHIVNSLSFSHLSIQAYEVKCCNVL